MKLLLVKVDVRVTVGNLLFFWLLTLGFTTTTTICFHFTPILSMSSFSISMNRLSGLFPPAWQLRFQLHPSSAHAQTISALPLFVSKPFKLSCPPNILISNRVYFLQPINHTRSHYQLANLYLQNWIIALKKWNGWSKNANILSLFNQLSRKLLWTKNFKHTKYKSLITIYYYFACSLITSSAVFQFLLSCRVREIESILVLSKCVQVRFSVKDSRRLTITETVSVFVKLKMFVHMWR